MKDFTIISQPKILQPYLCLWPSFSISKIIMLKVKESLLLLSQLIITTHMLWSLSQKTTKSEFTSSQIIVLASQISPLMHIQQDHCQNYNLSKSLYTTQSLTQNQRIVFWAISQIELQGIQLTQNRQESQQYNICILDGFQLFKAPNNGLAI